MREVRMEGGGRTSEWKELSEGERVEGLIKR